MTKLKRIKTKILVKEFPKKFYLKFKNEKFDYSDYLNLSSRRIKEIVHRNHDIKKWVNKTKKQLKSNNPAILIDLNKSLNSDSDKISNFRLFNIFLTIFFGEILVQDEKKNKVITVYDRDRRKTMKRGARYHQTHEGGSIHTDNVNIPEYWDFLIFSCVSQAPIGGNSLIVDGKIIYNVLKKKFPRILKTLMKDFWFEKRGLGNSCFKSPIISVKNKKVRYRYLRNYLESAHKKKKDYLSSIQIKALNKLDSLLENQIYQKKFKMKKYQILITQDSRILHGRTSFKDHKNAVPLDKYNPLKKQHIKRTMDRMWIREK